MTVNLVKIDCANIKDWGSFHEEFARVLGFPDFYGRNMDAWIDCMSSLSDPNDGMTQIHCEKGEVVTIELANINDFKSRCPEQYDAIIECSAFVNWRLIEIDQPPVIALSFHE